MRGRAVNLVTSAHSVDPWTVRGPGPGIASVWGRALATRVGQPNEALSSARLRGSVRPSLRGEFKGR